MNSKNTESDPEKRGGFDFEKDLARLEDIVKRLESGELPLDKSLDLFKEGKTITHRCARELGRLEQSIQKIVDQEGADPEIRDFLEDSGTEEES